MSISEITSYRDPSGDLYCPRCNTPLLPHATFCSSCGEPLNKKKDISSLLQDEHNTQARYRLTALLRRSPHVNLYFALDNQQSRPGQQRMIAIRDIDITSLHDETRIQAIELVQQEYDSLHHWHLPHVMHVIDLRYFQGHLYMVSDYPSATSHETVKVENTHELAPNTRRLYTLLHFLQSGERLPSEQQTLKWISYLCQALDGLHQHQIVISELDLSTIILNENSGLAEPALMISWSPSPLRKLFPPPQVSTTLTSYFIAPEAIQGQAEPRSDIYSLGAILYLLLVGSPPDESALRTRGRLYIPRNLSWRVGPHVIDCMVMALSIEPSERFQSAGAMAEALNNPLFRRPKTVKLNRRDNEISNTPNTTDDDVETVRLVPLSQKYPARGQGNRPRADTPIQIPSQPATLSPTSNPQEAETIQSEWKQQPPTSVQPAPLPATPLLDASGDAQLIVPTEQVDAQEAGGSQQEPSQTGTTSTPPQTPPYTWKKRITGMLPAITFEWLKESRGRQAPSSTQSTVGATDDTSATSDTSDTSDTNVTDTTLKKEADLPWFKQLQRMILGQQQHKILAAAIIESPLRVQPDQSFALRLHIVGRDEPTPAPGTQQGDHPAGLSDLVQGNTTLIEVRSVLHQSFAYLVQQTTVTIPAEGYVAEVTIPMQPLSNMPGGRRDRLHIFFLDEHRHPLYEKPFVVEIFVSPLVKRGQEGHNVLTIPT
jgi:serine/threonine protein kinase